MAEPAYLGEFEHLLLLAGGATCCSGYARARHPRLERARRRERTSKSIEDRV